jgi:hypothetical protein
MLALSGSFIAFMLIPHAVLVPHCRKNSTSM